MYRLVTNEWKNHLRSECMTPTVRGSGISAMLWGGHFAGMVWVPLEGRVTANQYKAVLSDHLNECCGENNSDPFLHHRTAVLNFGTSITRGHQNKHNRDIMPIQVNYLT